MVALLDQVQRVFQRLTASDTRTREYARLVALADEARNRKQWAGAADLYDRALALRPDRAPIWVQFGNVAKEARDFSRSRRAYQAALDLSPDDADVHLQLGHLLKVTGDREAARDHYGRAATLDPANREAAQEYRSLAGAAQVPGPAAPRRAVERPLSLDAKLMRAKMAIGDLLAPTDAARIDACRIAADLDGARDTFEATVERIDRLLRGLHDLHAGPEADRDRPRIEVVFDISDLIQYFRHHRLPTGIQRVQIEVTTIAILKAARDVRIRLCCFTEADDDWREVPLDAYLNLCELSLTGNDWTVPEWTGPMQALDDTMRASADFGFGQGAYLVNIGTSWWLQNYFLHLREAKRRSGVRYVPFVHDMIPIMTPEYCVDGLVQDFISWAQGVFSLADLFLVNSEATRNDLKRVGTALGYAMEDRPITVVRLDADYRKPRASAVATPHFLSRHRLAPGRFVLFVSTVEARKNHAAVFDAWIELCKARGEAAVPKLVCVGSRGWLNDATYAKIAGSSILRGKVVMLTGVSDVDLALLYEECRFSVYPSFYEGWGLPVTESLCHGKTVLVSRSSSLPEAGGPFVDYFEPGDQADLVGRLETLIFDDAYRAGREALIARAFKPRLWEDIADEITAVVRAAAAAPATRATGFEPIEPGRYYGFARVSDTIVYEDMRSAEVFRVGHGWWGLNPAGCWLKPGAAQLGFRLLSGAEAQRLYLGLRGLPGVDTPYDVTVGDTVLRGTVKAGEIRWVTMRVEADADPDVSVVIEGFARQMEKPRADQEAVPITLGVVGFMVCPEADGAARARFAEAVALGGLDELARGTKPPARFAPLRPAKPVAPVPETAAEAH